MACLIPHLPIYTYLLTYLSIYLFTYLPICLFAYLPICLLTYLPVHCPFLPQLDKRVAGAFNTSMNNLLKTHLLKSQNLAQQRQLRRPTPKVENSKRTIRARERNKRIRKMKEQSKAEKTKRRELKESRLRLAKGGK